MSACRQTYGAGPAQVYHCYAGDELLYIGSSTQLTERMIAHRRTAIWGWTCDRVETTDHESLTAAREVEMSDIYHLRPRWNINGRGCRDGWGLSDYVEVLLATSASSNPERSPAKAAAKILRLTSEMRLRFPDVAETVVADLGPHLSATMSGRGLVA